MDVLRQPLIINGRPFTVVGVAADGFTGPELGQPADIWLPIAALPAINTAQAGWLDERGTWWLRVIGRLEPGTTTQQAGAAVAGIAARSNRRIPTPTRSGRLLSRAPRPGCRPGERGEFLPLTALLLTVTGARPGHRVRERRQPDAGARRRPFARDQHPRRGRGLARRDLFDSC